MFNDLSDIAAILQEDASHQGEISRSTQTSTPAGPDDNFPVDPAFVISKHAEPPGRAGEGARGSRVYARSCYVSTL